MDITILGSGTGVPSVKRASPGILVRINKDYILLDSGSGTLRQLAKLKLTSHQIGWLAYTHFHPDHSVDLISFLFTARYHVTESDRTRINSPLTQPSPLGGEGKGEGSDDDSIFTKLARSIREHIDSDRDAFRRLPLCLIGPKGLKSFYQGLLKVYGRWISASAYKLTLKEAGESRLKFRGWSLKTTKVVHEKDSVAYRIEAQGKSFVYSGDTDYCESIIKLAYKADVLVLECSGPDVLHFPGHLTPRLVGMIARKAQPKRIILTHLYPVCDEYDLVGQVRKVWKGQISLAKDLMKISL